MATDTNGLAAPQPAKGDRMSERVAEEYRAASALRCLEDIMRAYGPNSDYTKRQAIHVCSRIYGINPHMRWPVYQTTRAGAASVGPRDQILTQYYEEWQHVIKRAADGIGMPYAITPNSEGK